MLVVTYETSLYQDQSAQNIKPQLVFKLFDTLMVFLRDFHIFKKSANNTNAPKAITTHTKSQETKNLYFIYHTPSKCTNQHFQE